MNKREYCESRKSIAYYSGLNGLEIKGIEYGINDLVYCVSGCWYGGKAAQRFHRCKIYYPANGKDSAFFRVHGYKIPLEIYRERVEEKHFINISKNAIKNKSEMFADLSNGSVKQVGYVITGKTEFDRGDYSGYSTQYIDLWVTILTVVDTVF